MSHAPNRVGWFYLTHKDTIRNVYKQKDGICIHIERSYAFFQATIHHCFSVFPDAAVSIIVRRRNSSENNILICFRPTLYSVFCKNTGMNSHSSPSRLPLISLKISSIDPPFLSQKSFSCSSSQSLSDVHGVVWRQLCVCACACVCVCVRVGHHRGLAERL